MNFWCIILCEESLVSLLTFYISADNLLDPEIGFLKDKVIDRNCDCCDEWIFGYRTLLKAQNYFYVFVSDSLFDLFITLCIILNTTFMSLEHHNQPEVLTSILSVENYVRASVSFVYVCLTAFRSFKSKEQVHQNLPVML